MKFSKVLAGIVAGAILVLATTQSSMAMSSEQRLADFGQLVNIVERYYGPLQWKKTTINLDFKAVTEEFRGKVARAQNDAEFYRLLAQFISQLKDAHVSPVIPSTYRASLGFVCDLIEGKVLVETVNRLRLPEMLFPFNKGDQLLAIGGVPVNQAMAELMKVGDTGFDLSAKRIAAARLTSRRESNGLEVPKGVTTITILPKGAAQPITVTATWILAGTPLVELDDLGSLMNSTAGLNTIRMASDSQDLLQQLKKLPMFNLSLPQAQIEDLVKSGVQDLGAPKSMFTLPAGAKVYDDLPVTAAIYEAAGKKIGVLRIPSYTEEGMTEVLARALSRMQDETDVLVLDQTNNPGGSVSQVSDIVSLFADKSYKDMDFVIRPSLSWLKNFQDVNQQVEDMLAADPKDLEANALKARFAYLETEMRDSLVAKRNLTNPVSLNYVGTFGMIQPSTGVHYSKPVLLLINELDFSGGDAFPAIMKDNGRVTLFGTRTSGAGGNVREYGPLSNSFFKFNLTESLMVRPNGQFMENLGVTPDVDYTVTEDDFMNGYRNYVKAFTKEALKLTGMTQEQIDAAKL